MDLTLQQDPTQKDGEVYRYIEDHTDSPLNPAKLYMQDQCSKPKEEKENEQSGALDEARAIFEWMMGSPDYANVQRITQENGSITPLERLAVSIQSYFPNNTKEEISAMISRSNGFSNNGSDTLEVSNLNTSEVPKVRRGMVPVEVRFFLPKDISLVTEITSGNAHKIVNITKGDDQRCVDLGNSSVWTTEFQRLNKVYLNDDEGNKVSGIVTGVQSTDEPNKVVLVVQTVDNLGGIIYKKATRDINDKVLAKPISKINKEFIIDGFKFDIIGEKEGEGKFYFYPTRKISAREESAYRKLVQKLNQTYNTPES